MVDDAAAPENDVATAASVHSEPELSGQHPRHGLWVLTLGSVGVVYGDIGTLPTYALREALHATASGGREPSDWPAP